MRDQLHNPLFESLVNRTLAAPCVMVIFGATGDLTHRKLIPALYNLAADGDLPDGFAMIGFARRPKTDEEFRAELRASTTKYSRRGLNDELWENFASSIFYHRSEFADNHGYLKLITRLTELDARQQTRGNRLFYLAVAPHDFPVILEKLRVHGLNRARPGAWTRVIVEKPFGSDLATARALNEAVRRSFTEHDTFRIDHFLGKETAQNIMVLRFANAIFEPLWNHRHIDHLQITASEPLGVEGRGPYYDAAGALRDMVQNHLLQLLTLVTMEPPTGLEADSVRDEKVKVLRALRPLAGQAVGENVVRGQYSAGTVNGLSVAAYRDEPRVDPQSNTETYVALRLHIDNWRWAGVPIYLRVGKRLPKAATEIAVQFKNPPPVLFNREPDVATPNVLVIRIQPDEGVSLRMQAKIPGPAVRVEPVKMDFHYGTSFGQASPEAYERLLLDAMAGDATLFARRDEVECAWAFIDAIEHAWHNASQPPPLHLYPAGSWGPKAADELLLRDGRAWRRL